MDSAPDTVTGRGRIAAGAVSAAAALVVAGSVAGDVALMRTAGTSFCGTCAASARSDLLVTGLASAVLWPAAWAVAREAVRPAARAVAVCGAAALAGWAVAVGVAFRWLLLG